MAPATDQLAQVARPAAGRAHRARPGVVIVTPALASANNGNWQTAQRWGRMLAGAYRVRLAAHWDGGDDALLIALHARRSAASVAAWRAAGTRPLLLALTGTDLYRDIHVDAAAQASLAAADAIVVLNELGARQLPAPLRARCQVLLQSCAQRRSLAAPEAAVLRVLMVGHLRDEKDPLTYLRAVQRLAARRDLRFDHIGGALDPALGAAASALARAQPSYRWHGALPRPQVRRWIQRAHLLVHASRMEGGANVVIEALRSGTPVLASRIDGNLGLLGADYPATFAVGDDAGLAAALARARDDPAMLAALRARCAERAPRFAPENERSQLRRLVAALLPAAGAP